MTENVAGVQFVAEPGLYGESVWMTEATEEAGSIMALDFRGFSYAEGIWFGTDSAMAEVRTVGLRAAGAAGA